MKKIISIIVLLINCTPYKTVVISPDESITLIVPKTKFEIKILVVNDTTIEVKLKK